MRGVCFVVLLVVAGCASTRSDESKPERLQYSGEAIDYAVSRPEEGRPSGVSADLTLVDLDAGLAEELLFIDGHADISPRSFRNAMGEVAAVNAAYGHGELLAHETISLNSKEPTEWGWRVDYSYLQDWEISSTGAGELLSPVFNKVTDGVECELEVKEADGRFFLLARTTSSQLVHPIGEFRTSLGTGSSLSIQIPEVSVMERLGSESMSKGETAMFQLSRGHHGEHERIRLLFVRVESR